MVEPERLVVEPERLVAEPERLISVGRLSTTAFYLSGRLWRATLRRGRDPKSRSTDATKRP